MKPLRHVILAAAVLAAAPLLAQGDLKVLPQGEYVCALPGSADGPAWSEVEGHGFSITGASSYKTSKGSGTYLLEGRRITFTRGPLKGHKMMRVSGGLLQELDKGDKLGRLRCHRTGPLTD